MPDPDSSSWLVFRGAPRGLDRRLLRDFARQAAGQVAGGRHFTCLISNDKELLRLNRQFLCRDYPADVLSFPSRPGEASLGEIAISAGRARQQAERLGHSVEQEICVLMLHGILHLLGMDHENDRGRMRRAESRWRKQFGLPAGLVERSRK